MTVGLETSNGVTKYSIRNGTKAVYKLAKHTYPAYFSERTEHQCISTAVLIRNCMFSYLAFIYSIGR